MSTNLSFCGLPIDVLPLIIKNISNLPEEIISSKTTHEGEVRRAAREIINIERVCRITHCVASEQLKNLKKVHELMKKYASQNMFGYEHNSYLYNAVKKNNHSDELENDVKDIVKLIPQSKDFCRDISPMRTVLTEACRNESIPFSLIEFLLQNKVPFIIKSDFSDSYRYYDITKDFFNSECSPYKNSNRVKMIDQLLKTYIEKDIACKNDSENKRQEGMKKNRLDIDELLKKIN